jgi:hypothetical protein
MNSIGARTAASIVVLVAAAAPTAAPADSGFAAPHPSASRPHVVCATGLPHLDGLYCASPAIAHGAYDGMGVVRLARNGTVRVVPSGSDLLNAIERDPSGVGRPPLAPGRTWRADGYACGNVRGVVSCRRGTHGFRIGARLRVL